MFKPNMFNTTMNNGVDAGTFHADDMFNFPCDKVTSNGIEGHAKPNMRNGTILLCWVLDNKTVNNSKNSLIL